MRESDKTQLENQRAANRAAAVEDVRQLAAFVADARRRGLIEGRSRLSGTPIVPGGRLWLMVTLCLDHRAVFNRCLAGEYESVSSAGRDAGLARAMPRRRVELGKDAVKSARSIHAALDPDELREFLPELVRQDPKRAARAIFNGLDEKGWGVFGRELAGLETERERRRRSALPWGTGRGGKRRGKVKGSRVY